MEMGLPLGLFSICVIKSNEIKMLGIKMGLKTLETTLEKPHWTIDIQGVSNDT